MTTGGEPSRREPNWRLAAFAAAAVAMLVAYLPAWQGVFVFDDISEIVENPGIRVLWPPWVPMFAGSPLPHRPIPYYTFAIDHALHGLDPRGYHATNLAIHLLNGGLVAWVLAAILRRQGSGLDHRRVWAIAIAAAAIWMVHPLTTQAVVYVYQRMESLGATAILATVAAFLVAVEARRPGPWLAASVAASGLGMLCKEHVAAAPVVVLLVDWLAVGHNLARPWRSLAAAVRARPRYYAALFATPLVAVALVMAQRARFTDLSRPPAGPLLYAANQPLVILSYLRLAVWPVGQCFDWYALPVTDPRRLAIGGGCLVAALAVAVTCLGRRPLVTLAVLGFLALLAPTSSIMPVNDLMVEHRMYLPLAILCGAAAMATAAACERLLGADRGRRAAVFGLLVVGGMLAAATWLRSGLYASRLALWQDVVAKAPRNPRGWQTLGLELMAMGRFDAALAAFDRSLAVVDREPVTHLARSYALLELGRPAEAVAAADRAAALAPENPEAWLRRAAAVIELGRPAEAVEACRKAFAADPPQPDVDGRIAGRHGLKFALLARAVAALDPPPPDAAAQVAELIDRADRLAGDARDVQKTIAAARASLTARGPAGARGPAAPNP